MDRVRAYKLEDPSDGGTEADEFPTTVDPHEDALDVRGITFQDDTSDDDDVAITRDASGNLLLADKLNAPRTLTELAAGAAGGYAGAAPYLFRGDGHFRAATAVDVVEVNAAFTISKIVARREIAGSSGTTEVDVKLNGSSIFTTTANRPKILASSGDGARVEAVPDVTAVPAGARLELEILEAEVGGAQDLLVVVRS